MKTLASPCYAQSRSLLSQIIPQDESLSSIQFLCTVCLGKPALTPQKLQLAYLREVPQIHCWNTKQKQESLLPPPIPPHYHGNGPYQYVKR